MSALALVVLGRLRTRWRGLTALAILTGLGLGLFSGAIGIARRTDSSPARIASATESPHVEWNNISFEDMAAFRLSGDERFATVRQWVGFVDVSGGPVSHADFVGPVDNDVGVERPFVRLGVEPVAVNEILLNETLAEQSGFGIGDAIPVALLGSDYQSIEPFEFVVAGIGTAASEHGFVDDTQVTPLGIVSRTFAETHPGQVVWVGGGAVLPDGPISRADASELFADLEWPITIIGLEREERARSALRPTVASLVVLGGLGLLATMMVAGFALLRALEAWQRDREVLRAIGLKRRTIRRVDMATTAMVLGVAMSIGLAVNIALSPLGPVGPLRQYEPDSGVRIDVVSIGALALATVVLGALSLLLLFARSSTSASPRAGFTSNVSVALLSGSTRASRRSLVLSTVLAIIAVAAAAGSLPYLMSLHALVENPDRYGQPWAAMGRNRFGDQSPASIRDIATDPDVAGVATLAIGSVIIDGVANVTAAGYEVVSGDDVLVVTSGRRATRPNELVIGSATRADFGFELGDEITMSAIATLSGDNIDSPSSPVTGTIVGDALFPAVNSAGAGAPRLNSGVMMSRAMWDELTGGTDLPEVTLVSVAPGVDVQSVIDRHPNIEDLGASATSTEWFTNSRPAEIRSADDARSWMLVGLASLTVLVAGILSISLRVLVVGQSHDIAVLRALGSSRRRVRQVVLREGILLLTPTLLIGVPIGIGFGRLLYSRLAADIGVLTAPTTPLWASAAFVTALAALSLSGMYLATGAAARVPPATTLRAN